MRNSPYAGSRRSFPQTLDCPKIGSDLRSTGMNRNQVTRNAGISGFGQQSLNDSFGFCVFSFTKSMMPNLPLRVSNIECRPILVVKCLPVRVVAIDQDRK